MAPKAFEMGVVYKRTRLRSERREGRWREYNGEEPAAAAAAAAALLGDECDNCYLAEEMGGRAYTLSGPLLLQR